jgi:hypothetical protein
MALESTHLLPVMSTKDLLGVKGGRRARLTNSPPYVGRLCRNCGSLDVSQNFTFFYVEDVRALWEHTYGPPQPVTGKALLFICRGCS